MITTGLNQKMTRAEVVCRITGTIKLKKPDPDEDGLAAAESTDTAETVTLTVENPKLWNPGKAYLYRLRVEGEEDSYTETFGIRSVKVTDKEFLINVKPFYFKGFGKHEDSEIHEEAWIWP